MWRKLFFLVSICLLDPKGVGADLQENEPVDGPTVFCPNKSWTRDEGARMARFFLAVLTRGRAAGGGGQDGHPARGSLASPGASPAAERRVALGGCSPVNRTYGFS